MDTTIPFSGFYNTIHDSLFDDALEMMLSDSSGCRSISDRISNDIWSHTCMPFSKYAKQFTLEFGAKLNEELKQNGIGAVKLDFDEMTSPKEYNFTTDRIFAKISRKDVRILYRFVDKTILDRVIEEQFTSRDGFSSYYTPDRTTWGTVDKWDHNQVGTIITALVEQLFDKDDWEYQIVEDWSGDGMMDTWVYDGLDDEGKRLVKIAGYLREREERKFGL